MVQLLVWKSLIIDEWLCVVVEVVLADDVMEVELTVPLYVNHVWGCHW